MKDDLYFDGVDPGFIRREKDRARKLRKSAWWQRKIAAGQCYYCKQEIPPAELTMDHIVPLARGGTSTKGNLVAACKSCNTKKRTMLPLEWDEYMASLE